MEVDEAEDEVSILNTLFSNKHSGTLVKRDIQAAEMISLDISFLVSL